MPVSDLSQSPLVIGAVYALRLGARSGGTDYGQGSELGLGKWILTDGTRSDAATQKATGYYRPEDMELDPIAWANGIARICWTNTGRDESMNYGMVFTEDGKTAYIHVMHRDQTGRPNPMGYPEGTDDMIKITGFKPHLVQ